MKRIAGTKTICLAMVLTGTCGQVVYAGGANSAVPSRVAHSRIGASALAQVHGRAAVNVAAGTSNVQSNMAALATGSRLGAARVDALQGVAAKQEPVPGIATAVIGPRVFAHASGLLSINQASGHANVHANTAALALGAGVEIVTDNTLAATVSNAGSTGGMAGRGNHHQQVSVSDNAFVGARGLVQVNQSAGSGNATANNFALSVEVGTQP